MNKRHGEGKTVTHTDRTICPRCGKSGTVTEVDLNTGEVLLVCSSRTCRALRAKGWF
jgi:uncharacterized OB-fold protein